MNKILDLGKIDYNNSGRKNCRVTIDIELRDDGELSICGNIWNPRGTDCYSCGQNIDEIAELFPHNKNVQRIHAIWKRWHLNHMHAGCEHQRADKWQDVRIPAAEVPNTHANRDERGVMAIWVLPTEHKDGLLTKPCPQCGYEYGSSWLKEELPGEVKQEVLAF